MHIEEKIKLIRVCVMMHPSLVKVIDDFKEKKKFNTRTAALNEIVNTFGKKEK